MRAGILIIVCTTVLCLHACKEKTDYGTSIAFENQLNDSIAIQLYPKYESYNNRRIFLLAYNESQIVYSESGQNKDVTSILQENFDSIVIYCGEKSLKFSSDTVVGYGKNIFIDQDCWTKDTVFYENPTQFSSNPNEDFVYSLTLKMSDLE